MNLIGQKAPADEIARRLSVCATCEFKGEVPIVKTPICKACGCPLVNKTKSLKPTCPKGKW